MADSTAQFEWKTHEGSTRAVAEWIANFAERNPVAGSLKQRMLAQTGTRFFDWVDRIGVAVPTEFEAHGYVVVSTDAETLWRHPLAMLPDVFQSDKDLLSVKVDRVADFLHANGFDDRIEIVGAPGADVRRACISHEADTEFHIVERHGSRAWDPEKVADLAQLASTLEAFRLRRRDFDKDADAFAHAAQLVKDAVQDLRSKPDVRFVFPG